MEDRRIQKRRNLIYYLEVFEQVSGRLLGRLVDITLEGMMLISNHQLPPVAVFQLRLRLPSQDFDEPFLEFEARSVWCRPDVNPNFFDTGFEFQNLKDRDRQIIQTLVSTYGFPNAQERVQSDFFNEF